MRLIWEEVSGVYLFMYKTMLEFILWSMLYLEGWSSRSGYFYGVALLIYFWYAYQMKQLPAFTP